MAQPSRPVFVLDDFTGGHNAQEAPNDIGANQFADARNVEFRRSKGLRRRRGSVKNITGVLPFAALSSVVSLFRHTPGQSETSMELWGISNDATPELSRIAAGNAWTAAIALADAIANAAAAWFMRGVSFNGKLFLPYDSAVDRMHVWDGSSVRRMGIAASAAATVANTGAGAYAATLRYYKVQWAAALSGIGGTLFSELSAAVSFTPSGAGTAARVTIPAQPSGDPQTFWRLFGSPDGVNYYLLASDVPAVTTYDDTAAPVTYATITTAPGFPTDADYFTTALSAKFVLVDAQQLLLAGSHETAALSSSVYYTPALGTSGFNIADDERVPSTNRIDVAPQQGGGITGLGGPIGGTPVVFKIGRTYLLNPTNDVTLPYTVQLLSDTVGCISYQGIVLAEDESGAPALYWPARRGYYRYGAAGLEYLGTDIEDLWATVNLSATYGITADYHRETGQLWIFLPVSAGTTPSVRLKFHVHRAQRVGGGVVRGGWVRDDGNGATCSAICLFSETPGSPMSLRLKPYIAAVGSGGEVYKADADGENRDDNDATGFTAYVVTRAIERGMGEEFGIQTAYVQGVAESSVTLDVGLRADFAASDTVTATAALTTTRAVVTSDIELSECDVLQVRVADQSAADQHWVLDRIGVRFRGESPKG